MSNSEDFHNLKLKDRKFQLYDAITNEVNVSSAESDEGMETQEYDNVDNKGSENQGFMGENLGTKSHQAPVWVYGTTLPASKSSCKPSSASGLCLSERGQTAIAQPEVIQNILFPTTELLQQKIVSYRRQLTNILTCDLKNKPANPLLVITGPSVIENPNQAKACAQWVGGMLGKCFDNLPVNLLPQNVAKIYQRPEGYMAPRSLCLSIRTNLTKYNYDHADFDSAQAPKSIMTFEIEQGIPMCRALLCELAEICPIVGEVSDTITPQYLSDLYCLGIVSPTLLESQLHRELVSGVSYAVGFSTSYTADSLDKDFYAYKINSALEAMYASSNPHQFLSVTKIGTVAVVGTIGNEETFIILSLNSQMEIPDLKEIIRKVYSYPHIDNRFPKIMLDTGKISYEEFQYKQQLLEKLLVEDQEIKHKIIGVLIDSGENYIPNGLFIDLTCKPPDFMDYSPDQKVGSAEHLEDALNEEQINHKKLIQLNNYFIKSRIYKSLPHQNTRQNASNTELKSDVAYLDKYYEHLITADRMIHELDRFNQKRQNIL
ncbi:Piso0_004786 [Millerozyma farinosa CBS 7064]|uniref:3-deoxy-7-phosphoheptulonate synthase n=1 Tax=Pichia sorbitophila (strain ATCC MYA-4447 / BCRC 22081 / CBS 7064 / NBRC 10061 / NRRL Y-12695) TaxID=559304 RepID=G8Y0F0_PICSO|nr:Piso0_004786 [Millerozyma farinosa CBS 7064]